MANLNTDEIRKIAITLLNGDLSTLEDDSPWVEKQTSKDGEDVYRVLVADAQEFCRVEAWYLDPPELGKETAEAIAKAGRSILTCLDEIDRLREELVSCENALNYGG